MTKRIIALALFCAGLSARGIQAAPVNQVVEWNKALLVIVRTPGAQPSTIHPTHSFAIMHAAIYDAVNSIDKTHRPYLFQTTGASPNASQDAAAAAAAHEVLIKLYPTFQATLDAQFQQLLAQIPDGAGKAEGITIGQTVADQIIQARSDDHSADPVPTYVFGQAPGDFQSPPPVLPLQPQFFNWRNVRPFVLEAANQFRPGPPPGLTTGRYANAFNEIKSVGILDTPTQRSTATPDQALTGHFWNGAIQNYWNEITQTATLAHQLSTAESARVFALLNLAVADSVIAFYDAKYTYNRWRPVTAIRAADTDGSPKTQADFNWLPEVTNTPPDPSYPGAHAVVSFVGATVLTFFFERDRFDFNVTSEVLPGVTRSFNKFSLAAEEA